MSWKCGIQVWALQKHSVTIHTVCRPSASCLQTVWYICMGHSKLSGFLFKPSAKGRLQIVWRSVQIFRINSLQMDTDLLFGWFFHNAQIPYPSNSTYNDQFIWNLQIDKILWKNIKSFSAVEKLPLLSLICPLHFTPRQPILSQYPKLSIFRAKAGFEGVHGRQI